MSIYKIENETDLNLALNQARDGDVIENIATIPISIRSTIRTMYNLTFRGGSYAIIPLDFQVENPNSVLNMFIGSNTGLIFEGVTFKGLQDYQCSLVKGINEMNYLIFEECAFKNCDHTGIWASDVKYTGIKNCTFILNNPNGYGYGVWVGGHLRRNHIVRIYNSIFDGCRHSVAASYHQHDIIVDLCTFKNNNKHVIDRHAGDYTNSKTKGVGGGNYVIRNSVFYDKDRRCIKVPQPLENRKLEIYNNSFPIYGRALHLDLWDEQKQERYRLTEIDKLPGWCKFEDNSFLDNGKVMLQGKDK